jgi:hypothetical protein
MWPAIYVGLLALIPFAVAGGGWWQWYVEKPHPDIPKWRTGLTLVGLIAVSLEFLLLAFFIIYSRHMSELGPNFRFEHLCSRINMSLWAVSLVSVLLGKGRGRIWIFISGLLFFATWFVIVMSD